MHGNACERRLCCSYYCVSKLKNFILCFDFVCHVTKSKNYISRASCDQWCFWLFKEHLHGTSNAMRSLIEQMEIGKTHFDPHRFTFLLWPLIQNCLELPLTVLCNIPNQNKRHQKRVAKIAQVCICQPFQIRKVRNLILPPQIHTKW